MKTIFQLRNLPLGLLAIFCLASLAIVLHPGLREQARDRILSEPERRILSSVTADILRDGQLYEVLKISSPRGLFLEIYLRDENNLGHSRLLDQVRLPDIRDGYFDFRGQAVNLALDDVNGDGQLEIIAPTFDERLSAHLNIFRYNKELEVFEPLRQEAL